MTLWRIKNGMPSVADALLTVGGFLGVCTVFIPCIEPILSILEPLGLVYLGYCFALLVPLACGAVGIWLFLRNEKKLRWEVTIPRRVFAITATPMILVVRFLTAPWAFRAGIGFFEHLVLLVGCFLPIFGLAMRQSLRSPRSAIAVALWFQVSFAVLGVLAKLGSLVLRR